MRCPVCNKKNAKIVEYDYVNEKNPSKVGKIFSGLKVNTCRDCGSSWVSNPPTNKALGLYYKETYTPAGFGKVSAGSWPIFDARPVSALCSALLFTEFKEQDLFLDMGPGNGASFAAAEYLFKDPKLACIEYNETAIRVFKETVPGIIICDDILSCVNAAGQKIKIFYSGHCFEHLSISDIHKVISDLRKAIDPKGIVSIEVPLCPEDKFLLIAENTNHVPHLTFFSEVGFSSILKNNGFEVIMSGSFVGRTKNDIIRKKSLKIPTKKNRFHEKIMLARSGDWIRTDKDSTAGVLKFIAKPV